MKIHTLAIKTTSCAPLLAMLLLLNCIETNAQAPPSPSTQSFNPSIVQVQQWTLELQLVSQQCEQKTKALAQQIFDAAVAFRLKEKRFAESIEELKGAWSATPKVALPPANPFADSKLISKDLRQELINTGNPPSEFCKIILEPDQYISAGFPLTLKNVKLKPNSSEPGAIVLKYNGDYYLAVWCMGISGKPLLEEKTQLPFILFKDFSTLSD